MTTTTTAVAVLKNEAQKRTVTRYYCNYCAYLRVSLRSWVCFFFCAIAMCNHLITPPFSQCTILRSGHYHYTHNNSNNNSSLNLYRCCIVTILPQSVLRRQHPLCTSPPPPPALFQHHAQPVAQPAHAHYTRYAYVPKRHPIRHGSICLTASCTPSTKRT